MSEENRALTPREVVSVETRGYLLERPFRGRAYSFVTSCIARRAAMRRGIRWSIAFDLALAGEVCAPEQSGPWPSWRSAVALSANSRASTIASVDDCRWFSADQTGKRLNLRPRFAFSFPSSYVDILRLTQYVKRSWAATRWYFFGGSRLIVRNNQTCSLNFVEGAIGRLRACSGHWRPEKMSNSFTLFFNFVRKDNVNPRDTAANDECGNPWMIGSTPPIRRFLCYFDKRWGQQRKVLGMLD